MKGIEQAIDNDLSNPLKKASGKAGEDSGNAFTSGLKSSIGSAAGAIAKTAAVGFAAAGAGLVALGGFAIKAASDFQQTRIGFEGILGSAGEADAFLKKLQAFAASTPFEFPELATATQRLLSLGQTGDQAIETLRTIGDAASAVGAGAPEIEGVVTAIAQIQAKGKLSAEELNQIAERLPNFNRGNFFEILAKNAGKSTEEVKKLAEQGLIPADIATQSILESLKQVPGAMGAMDRQSKTLAGVMSTLKDNLRNALIEGVEPFLPAISGLLTKVTPIFTSAIQGLVGGITALVAAFKDGGTDITSSGFAGAMEVVGLALRAVVDFFKDNADTIGAAVGQVVSNVVERFRVLFDFFKTGVLPALKPVFEAIKDVLPDLLNLSDAANDLFLSFLKLSSRALKPILPILGKAIALVIRFTGVLARNKDVLLALTAAFLAFKAVAVISAIIAGISTAFESLGAAIFLVNLAIVANPIGAVVVALIALGAAVVIAYREFKPFRDAVDKTWHALQRVFDFITRNWKVLGAILLAPFLPFIAMAALVILNWQKVVDFFKGIGGAITDAFNAFINSGFAQGLIDFVTNTFKNIVQVVQGYLDIVIGIFNIFKALFMGDWTALWEGVKQVIGGVWAVISGIIAQGLNLITAQFKAGFDVLKRTVGASIDALVQFFIALPNRLISAIPAIASAAFDVGKAIIGGIAKGLVAAVEFTEDIGKAVANAVIRLINKIIDTINDKLEFNIDAGPFHFKVDPPDIGHIQGFAQGGIVTGPIGQPMLAVVHGGEEVLTPEQRRGGGTTINVFGRSDDDMVRKLAIEQRRRSLLVAP